MSEFISKTFLRDPIVDPSNAIFSFPFLLSPSISMEKVAGKLDDIYKTGKLAHVELDERALDALREFPVDGALNVLSQFLESNLEHVSNKSAYLCGVMKTYRQKSRASQQGIPTPAPTVNAKGPDEEKIKKILERTGYTLDVTTGKDAPRHILDPHHTPPSPNSIFDSKSRGSRVDRSKEIRWTATKLGRTDAWQRLRSLLRQNSKRYV